MVRFPLFETSTGDQSSVPLAPALPPKAAFPEDGELFRGLAERPARRPGLSLAAAALIHFAAVAALVLVPIFWPEPFLDTGFDPIRVMIYDPPPPPPPPLPRGSPLGGQRSARTAPVVEAPRPAPTPVAPKEAPLTAPLETPPLVEGAGLTVEAPGSAHGSESGVPEGMEEGVEGGVVGGVPGGVVGGVIGGTGTGPVPVRQVDRPPRLLRLVRPTYPAEAFVKKIEGTVVLEIVIDERGRVARTRIVQSVPPLNAAAIEAVQQWVFAPAQKQGRVVACVALAPVSFRIF